MRRWVLPDAVEDILAPSAWALERTRRQLLDCLIEAGFELVQPPLIEHLEALLTGTGHDLEAATFKLIDPLSGKLLGVRPDITPQIARIDATYFGDQAERRFCYAGTVLRTQAADGGSRVLTQVGAELFGASEVSADIEMVSLMIKAAREVNAAPLLIDFGHIGVFRALVEHFQLSPPVSSAVDDALARKAVSELAHIKGLSPEAQSLFADLTRLFGPAEKVLSEARERLPQAPGLIEALEDLARICAAATQAGARCSVDLADLPGLDYHTGIVYVAYLEGTAQVVARGGRYDGVGEAFMQADAPMRAATGFSFVDLRALAEATDSHSPSNPN